MYKHIFRSAKHIGEPKAFALVEPFHPCGFQWQQSDLGWRRQRVFFPKGQRAVFRRINFHHFDGLNAAPGEAQDALRAELLMTFKNLLLGSAAVSLLGLAAAITMPNAVLRGREDKVR